MRKMIFLPRNANLKKISLIMTSQIPYATHPGEMINRVKFHDCTPSSFEGVKVQVRTDRTLVNILDQWYTTFLLLEATLSIYFNLRQPMNQIRNFSVHMKVHTFSLLVDQNFECKTSDLD